MWELLTASVVWAFSFGLIKHQLVAVGLSPVFVAFARLVLSLLLFLPFLRLRAVSRERAGALTVIGSVQYGWMYVTYLYSYQFLAAHQVALFTAFTPLFVTLFEDLRSLSLRRKFWFTSLLAVAGAAVVLASAADFRVALKGFLMMQVSNACFAFGQVAYRAMAQGPGVDAAVPSRLASVVLRDSARTRGAFRDSEVFGWLYLGGVVVAGFFAWGAPVRTATHLSATQILTLLYLGLVASGLCFFLWNAGARKVNAGTLAVMNNAKIPLAVLCSLVFFHETAQWPRLLVGGAMLLVAVGINEKPARWSRSR